jgi:hypothetical protein
VESRCRCESIDGVGLSVDFDNFFLRDTAQSKDSLSELELRASEVIAQKGCD